MKHQTLRILAACLGVLAWIVLAVGIMVSLIIGAAAATILTKVSFLLGGFVLTTTFALMLLATSQLIYLFIKIEEDLGEIAGLFKEKAGE